MASYLPSCILNALLIIPHYIVSIRNSLRPVPPAISQSNPQKPLITPAVATAPPVLGVDKAAEELSEHEASASETGSEADVESNSSSVDGSWIQT